MSLSNRIREVRKKAGMSAEELGKATGKSHASIYSYEKDRAYPDSRFFQAMYDKLNVTPNFLLLGKELKKETTNKVSSSAVEKEMDILVSELELFQKEVDMLKEQLNDKQEIINLLKELHHGSKSE